MHSASKSLAAGLMLTVFAGTLSPDVPAISQESAEAALAALGAQTEVERDLLKTQQEAFRRAAFDRDTAAKRSVQFFVELDAFVLAQESQPVDQVAVKEREIAESERQRSGAIERGRNILARIQELQERISGLERKMAALRETLPRTRETLSGTWVITYLPGVNKGVFYLRQTGTLVQGQYQLDGGWKGSLQGTFVDGKIFLQRIDSKLGRSSELQGYLSPDGRSIRGTWQNYNLTDGGVSAGSWTANRQEE